jgi:cohesin domain-containing protein
MICKNASIVGNGLDLDRPTARLICFPSPPVFLFLGLLFLPTLAWSQAKPGNRGKLSSPAAANQPQGVRVNVGVSTAKPADTIDIPLTLSMPESMKPTLVSETISFPKKVLSLTKMEMGLAGEQSQAEIKSNVKDDSNDPEASLIDVTVSSKGPLKPGILAYMKFKVSERATKSTVVLKLLDSKVTGEGGQALTAAQGKDGEVTIFNANEEIPVIGCFFFSH